MRVNSRSRPSRPGLAIVEFALIAPIMVTVLIGLWEVARMVEVQQYLTNAAREGARQISTGAKSTAQGQQTVVDYLKLKGITAVVANVTVTSVSNPGNTDPTTATQLDQWRVSVTIPFSSVRWIIMNQVTSVSNLTASADWYSMKDVPLAVSGTIPLN